MRVTAIANCCSLATAVQKAMAEATLGAGSYASTAGDADPTATLANISSFYVRACNEAGVEAFMAELEKAEQSAIKDAYMSGVIAVTTHDGRWDGVEPGKIDVKKEAFTRRGWIPLIDWPSCHANAGHIYFCTLWFKQVKNLEFKSIRRRRPKPLPEWCVQEKVEEKK